MEHHNSSDQNPSLTMYLNKEVARTFAASEQNEKNFRTAAVVDRVIGQEIANLRDPLTVAELGGGAQTGQYDQLFKRLLTPPKGNIDWVDAAPYMLELARQYIAPFKEREEVLSFIVDDMVDYLKKRSDSSLDLAIMKYTLNYLSNLQPLMTALAKKLKPGGRLVATVSALTPELKSCSTNARYVYKGQEFPLTETRILQDGEGYGVKFLKQSRNPHSGYLEGAETTVYYHAPETIKRLAEQQGLKFFLGDWKQLVPRDKQGNETIDQAVLVLRK